MVGSFSGVLWLETSASQTKDQLFAGQKPAENAYELKLVSCDSE